MFEHRPFGHRLRLSVRGASHAPSMTFTLTGFPADFEIDAAALQAFMERRAPGRDALSTARYESDAVEWTAGVRDGRTTGETIKGRILNSNVRPVDYGTERTVPRPGHADFGQWVEQGRIPTGGGANSGRLTATYCAAGGLALQWLARRGVHVAACVESIGGRTDAFEKTIAEARSEGDSVGGVITCEVTGLPVGLGGALFAGIESGLSAALFAIPGVKGVSFGNGFEAAALRGSENDDPFAVSGGCAVTTSNRHGGVLGGRATSMPLVFHVAMKPTPTVFKPLESVDLATMTPAECRMKGRHDPCIVRRAVPVVEAVAAFVLADAILDRESSAARICLTLTARTLAEARCQYAAERLWVDMLELRIDLLEPKERARVRSFLSELTVPTIVTFRRRSDGGAFDGTESERIAWYREFLFEPFSPCPEILVDFEDDFHVADLEDLARRRRVRIVRSLHLFEGGIPDLKERCRQLVADRPEIAKVAIRPRSADEVAAYMLAARTIDFPHVVCLMGSLGVASRTLAVRLGSLWTYASLSGLAELGHQTPRELVRDGRVRVQTATFELFGVTGWPLVATRSPELHNAAFAAADLDAVMAAFPAETAAEVVSVIRRLNVRGTAVTIPHKESIIPLLDDLTPEARAIGAVNTVSLCEGRLVGHNTDAEGFSEALTRFLGRDSLAGVRAAVLGTGGASKAVVFALKRLGATVEVFHRRTPESGYDLFVNATPVDPIPAYAFTGREQVYDLRYLPAETPLMARARAAGCRVENGLSMLAAQARLQRKFWLGGMA